MKTPSDQMTNSDTPISAPATSEKSRSIFVRGWDWLTRPSKSLSEIGEQRAARLAASTTFAIFALLLIDGLASALRLGIATSVSRAGFSIIASLIAYLLTRTRWYRAGIFVFVSGFCATGFLNVIAGTYTGDLGTIILIYTSLGLIVASTFLSAWSVFLLVGLNIAAFFALALFNIPYPNNTGSITGTITAIGLVLIFFNTSRAGIERANLEKLQETNRALEHLSQDLEKRIQERTASLEASNQKLERRANQLQAVTNISRAISTVQDLDKLLPTIAQTIARGFGVYHVGIFLLDKRGEYAELRATNSEGGLRMLANGYRLRVDDEGIIGYVTKYGRARLAFNTGEDATYFNNPDLPETRTEICLPLSLGGNVIGALDVQSTEADAFSPEDIAALTALANQVSIAIQNAELYSQVQQSAAEIERAYREFIRQEWQKIVPTIHAKGYRFKIKGTTPFDDSAPASKESNIFSVAVTLRGETIGEIGMRTRDNENKITPEEMAILRAIADRVALALENARLFRDAQLRAATERAISEMSNRIAASVDIDSILQTTAESLSQLVSESEILIQLGSRTVSSQDMQQDSQVIL